MKREKPPHVPEALQDVPDLVPARMLNESAYCPRLAYLEWVQGEFADSVDTVEGRFQHRRVDLASTQVVPEASDETEETVHARLNRTVS